MYEYVMEERTVKALALLGVLAMVGMVVMPTAVSAHSADATSLATYYGYIDEDTGIAISALLFGASIGAIASGAGAAVGLGLATASF